MRGFCLVAQLGLAIVCLIAFQTRGFAQTFGIELHNTVMPASGAMGGTSFSRPLDLQSAINGNPATMTQYQGTQFGFGGAFIEATYNIDQSASLPLLGVDPYSGKSDAPPSALGNIGVTHEALLMGRPVTLGMGFMSNAGFGVDFRPFPESNGTHASYLALDIVNSAAIRLTPNLSFGASVIVGTSILDGPFVSSSSSQIDYSPRFTVGVNWEGNSGFNVGAFWQSKKNFNFENIVRFPGGAFQDIALDHPANVGFGISNGALMGGRLLLAADAIYKNHSNADFFRAVYDDQWAFMFGAQYMVNPRMAWRIGYAFNEDPTLDTVPGTIGGVVPIGGIPSVQYVQGQFAAISQHRLTGGVGIRDLMPGVDFDLALGGAFEGSKSFGATTASIESYWIGFGFTWRCGVKSDCFQCPSSSCCDENAFHFSDNVN